MNGKQYAEKLYPGQSNWIHIAANAYNKGYLEAKKAQLNESKLHRELAELREYKRTHEKMFDTGEGLEAYLGGL